MVTLSKRLIAPAKPPWSNDHQPISLEEPMKTTLLTLALAAIHLAAFAQGKVTFGNDANHLLVVVDDALKLWFAGKDPALAGLPAPQINTPYDVMSSLTAQLWVGTSAGSLTLQSTLNPAGLAGLADGRIGNAAVTLTGISGGATGFYQILIFETAAGSFANASTGFFRWYASTPVFSGAAGNFAPTPLTSMASWTPGPITLNTNIIPEPSTFVLAGLGVASLLLFRRRKQLAASSLG